MGEVYRAKDTRLGRDVAIKILPAEVSANVERKQRFEREARTISSLTHPNICALYDVGNQDGIEYLVLEFVEGETLEKRLAKSPLPTDVLLRHGIEIADALEKAHRSGVIHRDLKPGNVMLTKSGAKLLDFGLAKWSAANHSEEETLKTLTSAGARLTGEGSIVGTFQYMAPEQLEGKEADVRTDLFAFGEVLYEMATGRTAFAGKTKASLIAAILSAEPAPLSALQPMTPPALERLVRGCLEKDPDERWQTAHDVKLQLRAIAEGGSQSGVPTPIAAARKNRERVLLGVALAGLVAMIVLGLLYRNRTPEKQRVVRSYVKPMPGSSFVLGSTGGFTLSPDGLRFAYVAQDADGKTLLWVRSLDSLQAHALAGTDGAAFPFWSPDSRFIGFFAGHKLKKIEAAGGPPLALCDVRSGRGGTWNQDDVILFVPAVNEPIYRVSAAGGTPTRVTSLDTTKGETTHRWPFFLPDGRHFLYVAGTPFGLKEDSENAIMVGSLDSQESKFVLHSHSGAMYASRHILFLRENTLVAQPFDTKRLELTGDAVPIADPVQEDENIIHGFFSPSYDGLLAYLEGGSSTGRELILTDRNGTRIREVPGPEAYSAPRVSPDGKRLAYTISSSGYDIWSYDMDRGVKTRLTFGASAREASISSIWSPDGKRIAFSSFRGGKYGIYEKPMDGSGSETVLLEGSEQLRYPNDWSADGKFLAYQQTGPGTFEIWILPLTGERKPYRFLPSPFSMLSAVFSPDGKWLAYTSTESGEAKVYVAAFPGPGGKWQISPGSGRMPRWRHDGKELFYFSTDNKVMAAEVKANGSSLEIGSVRMLFETQPNLNFSGGYDVTADGQKFAIAYDAGQPGAAITLVVNWDAELKRK